jgi:hypothetical protein
MADHRRQHPEGALKSDQPRQHHPGIILQWTGERARHGGPNPAGDGRPPARLLRQTHGNSAIHRAAFAIAATESPPGSERSRPSSAPAPAARPRPTWRPPQTCRSSTGIAPPPDRPGTPSFAMPRRDRVVIDPDGPTGPAPASRSPAGVAPPRRLRSTWINNVGMGFYHLPHQRHFRFPPHPIRHAPAITTLGCIAASDVTGIDLISCSKTARARPPPQCRYRLWRETKSTSAASVVTARPSSTAVPRTHRSPVKPV